MINLIIFFAQFFDCYELIDKWILTLRYYFGIINLINVYHFIVKKEGECYGKNCIK